MPISVMQRTRAIGGSCCHSFGWRKLLSYRGAWPSCIPDQMAELRSLLTVPILKPEPADANEFPRIVSDDLESSPQSTGREQQIIGSYGRTLAAQARTQLRRYASIFALERQDGIRIQQRLHCSPDARCQLGI